MHHVTTTKNLRNVSSRCDQRLARNSQIIQCVRSLKEYLENMAFFLILKKYSRPSSINFVSHCYAKAGHYHARKTV